MTKTLICLLPPLNSSQPPLSGAILAEICSSQGHEVILKDINIELRNYLRFSNIPDNLFDDVFYEMTSNYSDAQLKVLNCFLDHFFQHINVDKFDYVVVSLFSYLAQSFGNLFFPALRTLTNAKIVVGGPGVQGYGHTLKDKKIIDEYIIGEAENALKQYFLLGNGPGIGNKDFIQLDNLDQYPFPNYQFYNVDDYKNSDNELVFSIIGSRGCVRSCNFCNVAATSPKYRFRSGKNIAEEIIQHYEMYGVRNFYFTDSLVNGSYKAFDDMCDALSGYNFDKPISWSGQYIIRSISSTPKDHFKKLKAAGCKELFVGIETGCDRIRFEMGKKFTNDDIEFYLENFAEIDVKILFLFFTGYINETIEDYNETLSMFARWQKYVATGTITGVETFNILGILPGTKLETLAIEKHFLFQENEKTPHLNTKFWLDSSNPTYDYMERVRRHLGIIKEAIKYKWPVWNASITLELLEKSIIEFNNPKNRYIPINRLGS